jgi:voltage-gated potassium channel Kch
MTTLPTRLPARIVAYCCGCRQELAESAETHLYTLVRCPDDPSHLAAVVKGPAGIFWLGVEAAILSYEMKYSPMRWFCNWWGLFKGRAGCYGVARFVTLVALLALVFHLPSYPIASAILATVALLVPVLFVFDILVSNTSIAFVSRFPAHPLRTAVLFAFSFLQIALAFAVLYGLFGCFNRGLSPISALYFSVVTITTLGYGDIQLTEGAALGQLIVVCELLVGLYFLATLFAVVVSWANGPPAPPEPVELDRVRTDPHV